MSEVERRYSFGLGRRAVEQLRELRRRDPDAHADVIVLLQETYADPSRCERLIDEHYADDLIQVVKPLVRLQEAGANVYIVKTAQIGAWRIITGGSRITRQVLLLAVAHRSEVYTQAKLDEVLNEYEEGGIPKLGDARSQR